VRPGRSFLYVPEVRCPAMTLHHLTTFGLFGMLKDTLSRGTNLRWIMVVAKAGFDQASFTLLLCLGCLRLFKRTSNTLYELLQRVYVRPPFLHHIGYSN
jgi:hypothetical protein